ncbi:MAG TPA: ABC-ATPase domain-containing protein, partial [Candidatus Obscuribacterales bacterium]
MISINRQVEIADQLLKPMSENDLRDRLQALDGQSYGAYKSLKGRYAFPNFTLVIDYVQGDPFAAPSQMRVMVPAAIAALPADLYCSPSRQIALEDYLVRQFYRHSQTCSSRRGSGKSGLLAIAPPSQAILRRTAASVTAKGVEVRFVVGLPAFGRRIAGQQAAALLCNDLPAVVAAALCYAQLDANALQAHCICAENADWLWGQLRDRGLVAFVAEGARLPRRSGVDERPLPQGAVPFTAPPSLRVQFTLPDGQTLAGMGVPQGITLIVGGGYHGKSTLLRAIEAGIYNHLPGDGREYVVTDGAAVKVRAEDGRSVAGVNIA